MTQQFKPGDILQIHGMAGSYYKDYDGTTCKVIKGEGWHEGMKSNGEPTSLYGYSVKCEDGNMMIFYRGFLKRIWPKLPRGDMDTKVSWEQCPWMTFPDNFT